ncbi:MAG: hemerythrin domain-containing protein, partial [Hamadaea sp.]|nr:hemerythrin domain-containing protein [Hamadaea sp.]
PGALTPEQLRLGRRLVDVHDGYRQQLRQVRDAVEQVASDTAGGRLAVRQNNWTLGAFCATFRRLLTVHHEVEHEVTFPALAAEDPALDQVIKKLEQEHEVIEELLARLDAACAEMIANPARLDRVHAGVERLSRALTSHFAYEEEELAEQVGRLEIRL